MGVNITLVPGWLFMDWAMKLSKPYLPFLGMVLLIEGLCFQELGAIVQADETLISTTAGLDLAKVEFLVITEREFFERLYSRALEKLATAGLHTKKGRRPDFPAEIAPTLTLTLDSKPIKDCSGKVLYTRKLELQEHVLTERAPRMRSWSTTWLNGGKEPNITDKVTIQQLEKDLDELVEGFILDYKVANRSKR